MRESILVVVEYRPGWKIDRRDEGRVGEKVSRWCSVGQIRKILSLDSDSQGDEFLIRSLHCPKGTGFLFQGWVVVSQLCEIVREHRRGQ